MSGRGAGRGNYGGGKLGNRQVATQVQLGRNFAFRRNFRTKKVLFFLNGEKGNGRKRKVCAP